MTDIAKDIQELIDNNIASRHLDPVFECEHEDRSVAKDEILMYRKYIEQSVKRNINFPCFIVSDGPNTKCPTIDGVRYTKLFTKFSVKEIMDKNEIKSGLMKTFFDINRKCNLHRSAAQVESLADHCVAELASLPDRAPELFRSRPDMSGENIVEFLERVWLDPWIRDGALSRPDFRRLDPKGEMALRNWLRMPDNDLPSHLHLPTKAELMVRRSVDPEAIRAARRLVRTSERQR